MRTIYDRHKGRYDGRRITAALRQVGELIHYKPVRPLRVTMGRKSLVRGKTYPSCRGAQGVVAPNALACDFMSAPPHQRGGADISGFAVADQELYLPHVMDLYNGEIVAEQIGARPVLAMLTTMLGKSFRRLCDALLPHSDQR